VAWSRTCAAICICKGMSIVDLKRGSYDPVEGCINGDIAERRSAYAKALADKLKKSSGCWRRCNDANA